MKVAEVMYTSVYTGLNPCVRKVAVHLEKVLVVRSTSADTDLIQIYVP
jgi:hypothetical protein